MHVDMLGSNAQETNVTPVLFALLPDKKKATYVRMFRMILDQVPRWNPEQVIIDFEISVVDALKEVFPCVNIQGCYFHFTQCLWRKVQDVGLASLYSRDEEIRRTIRMSAALAFLKPEDVDAGWIFVQGQTPSSEKVTESFDYFVDQWLENPAFPREKLGLSSTYKDNESEAEKWLHYRFGMAYLRPEDVEDVFCDLIAIQPHDPKLTSFVDYLTENYVDHGSFFPLKIWAKDSVELWRTTNAWESYHSRFHQLFNCTFPFEDSNVCLSFWTLFMYACVDKRGGEEEVLVVEGVLFCGQVSIPRILDYTE
ncbi:uncharacterized protein LOC128998893 [Macrosteles quadrilineatus]|uniref:uncharacterized protein LOC128998893 n=1 Tax=Macrosteles quadrilineatus TaxID=74068 RepID=UPI0023E23329|nr:uncharacterized protein LOC128998893 [Macrosteles quadrilineatus]